MQTQHPSRESKDTSSPKLLSVREAATLLGVHASTVYRAVRRRELVPDATTASGNPRFCEQSVEAYRQRRVRAVANRKHKGSHLPDVYDAALTIADQLDPDSLPQTITDVARDALRCSYSALWVLDAGGKTERVVTSGTGRKDPSIAEELLRRCELAGIPSQLGRPVRASYTHLRIVPENELQAPPRIRSLLAVPVSLGTGVLGDLYVANKWEDAGTVGFTDEDEWLLGLLASSAAQSIESTRLRCEAEQGWQAAEAERRRLDGILDALPEIVVVYSAPDGRILAVNRAGRKALRNGLRIGDHRRPGLVSGPQVEPVPEEETPFGRVLFGGEAYVQQELLLRRADGSVTPILASAAPILGAGGTVMEVLTIWQDISGLKEAERLKEQFLSLVSHELRTPLTSIKTVVSGLLREDVRWDEAQHRRFLETVDGEADRLTRLVSNLLDVSRLEAGLMEPERDFFALADLVSTVKLWLVGVLAERTLRVEVPPDLPEVYADYDQVGEVLINLVGNAARYSSPGEVIEVRAELDIERSRVVVQVRDEGPGISAEDMRYLFDRFYRGHRAAGQSGVGSGLGLAICRGIIEAHGERIWAESEPGHGATFSFTLPIREHS